VFKDRSLRFCFLTSTVFILLTSISSAQTDTKKNYQSVEDLDSIIKDAPERQDNPVFMNNLAAAYARLSEYDKALTAIKRAVEVDPNRSEFWMNMSVIYEHLKQMELALDAAKKAVERDLSSLRARTQSCDLSLLTGNNPEAVACYEAAMKMGQLDTSSSINYGAGLVRMGRAAQAVPILRVAADQFKQSFAARNALGTALFDTRDFVGAVAAFKSAVEMAPDNVMVRYNLALAQMAIKNRPGAISEYNFLKTSDPALAEKVYQMLTRDQILSVNMK
jgi:tetratricopeptide (TPR) repeat protein